MDDKSLPNKDRTSVLIEEPGQENPFPTPTGHWYSDRRMRMCTGKGFPPRQEKETQLETRLKESRNHLMEDMGRGSGWHLLKGMMHKVVTGI